MLRQVTESPAVAPHPMPASPPAAGLAIAVLAGEGSVTAAVERVGRLLISYPGVDLIGVSLTQIVPDQGASWVPLGERAWLREWSRPGVTASIAPGENPTPEQALSMPWVSALARRQVVVVPDSDALPPEAQQDRRELVACGIRALVTSAMIADGVMYGSLAMTRETPGEWPEGFVADVSLLSAALASRMSKAKAQDALADALRRGDQARSSQQEFFSAIGHELRTPIAAIVGTAELLVDDAQEACTPVADETSPAATAFAAFTTGVAGDAGVILSAGEQLLSVVEGLLSTAQDLGGGVESQLVDVADAVRDVTHWLSTPARAAGVTVHSAVPADTAVLTTPSGLRQILTNLVGNAITHNHRSGNVHVTTTRTRDEFGQERVRIAVRDDGPGLTAEQLRDVFRPFVRFAGPEVRGTGLGLSLSRSLAERDGGMMGVESTPGAGSVFWVDLPASAGPGH